MTTARKGGRNEADIHSINGAWNASNVSKAKQYQLGPGCKRKGINDRLKSGTPTTKHRLSQRIKRNGGQEWQYMPVNRWSEDNPAKMSLENGRKMRIRGSIQRPRKPITSFKVQKI